MQCELCERESETTEHHLIPREKKKLEDFGPTADLCKDCHRMIHATYNNKELAKLYSTVEALKVAPDLQKYYKWIKKQPGCTYFGSDDNRHRR